MTAAWTAQMIAPLADCGPGSTAFVARDFDCDDADGKVLRITAQGIYVAFLNGNRIGQDSMTPGWASYDRRHPWQSYDVASLLQPGRNRLEIWLADGWWRGPLLWCGALVDSCWGDRIAAMAQIDGAAGPILATDATWQSGFTAVTRSGLYAGEWFDARIAPQVTHGVEVLPFDQSVLVAQEIAPVRAMAPLSPVTSWFDDAGRQILDFGQNCAAQIRFSVCGAAGARVTIENAEVTGPDGLWDNRNLRLAEALIDYTLTDGAQDYQPLFTFMGFRYLRVTVTGEAALTGIHALPITSTPERAASFKSGHALVNRLVENTVWSLRSNFIEVPTDCPQRDERLGWTGDAQVFAGTACWLAEVQPFLRKYLREVMADQRPNGAIAHFSPDPSRLKPMPGLDWSGSTGWGDVITILPWQLYLHYGDEDILRECLPAMCRWVDYLWSMSDGPLIRTQPVLGRPGFTFGDWLQPEGDGCKAQPTIGDDCAATIYHFISTDLVARVAAVLGDRATADRMRDRADRIRHCIVTEFFTATGRMVHDDQTSYALAFRHGLVPPEMHAAASRHFRRVVEHASCRIGTGFIGTPDLLPGLVAAGLSELAGKVLLNEEVPGWLYQVKMGATTIWERWGAMAPDGSLFSPEMNSYNHYAYGAVCQWLFEGVAGLTPCAEAPGFVLLRIDPVIIPALSPLEVCHQTPLGKLSAAWRLDGQTVVYEVDIPPGSAGEFITATRPDLTVDGRAVSDAAHQDHIRLGSGRHRITFTQPQ